MKLLFRNAPDGTGIPPVAWLWTAISWQKIILRENCLGGSKPFYISSKYYSCSFSPLLLWYPRHLPTVAAWMSFSWHQCHWHRAVLSQDSQHLPKCAHVYFYPGNWEPFSWNLCKGCCTSHIGHKNFTAVSRQTSLVPLLDSLNLSTLLTTGVRRVCVPPAQDRLLDWLKRKLLNHLACQLIWLAVTPCSGYLSPGFVESILLGHSCSVSKYPTYLY